MTRYACTGCGSAMTDAEILEGRKVNPLLMACCPERNMQPVFAQPFQVGAPTAPMVEAALDAFYGDHEWSCRDPQHTADLRDSMSAALTAALAVSGPIIPKEVVELD